MCLAKEWIGNKPIVSESSSLWWLLIIITQLKFRDKTSEICRLSNINREHSIFFFNRAYILNSWFFQFVLKNLSKFFLPQYLFLSTFCLRSYHPAPEQPYLSPINSFCWDLIMNSVIFRGFNHFFLCHKYAILAFFTYCFSLINP